MDRWKAEQGRGREKRKIRTENRRERVRRQKMQMREKVGKSRNTVFIQWFVAPEGRKVGGRRGTWRHGSSLCVAGVALMAAFGVAGVALGDMDLHFVWQVWHLATWILTLRGRRGTYGTGLALVAWVLGDMDLHFAWQAWHLATWILTLRGRRGTYGTYGTGLALVARLGLSWRRGRRGFWRGRRGTWWHGPSLCMAGVALGDMDLHFAWQAWHLWHWAGSGGALGVSVGAVGVAAFGVAGVALGDMDLHFAWQAWHLHLWHWAGSGGALGSQVSPWAPRLFAWQAWQLGDMDLHFAWLTYNLLTHNLSTHNLLTHNLSTHRTCPRTHTHNLTSTLTLRGRRGTWRHGPSLCVAGVALGDMVPFRLHHARATSPLVEKISVPADLPYKHT